jgi:phage shock protein A
MSYFDIDLIVSNLVEATHENEVVEEVQALKQYITELHELIEELKDTNSKMECEIDDLNGRVSELEEGC